MDLKNNHGESHGHDKEKDSKRYHIKSWWGR